MASSESNGGGWLAFGYNVVATVARYGYTAITSSFSGASYICTNPCLSREGEGARIRIRVAY